MALLRSALFALLFYPGTALFVLAALVAAPFGAAPLRAAVHGWSGFHHWLVTRIVGIRFAVEGEMPSGQVLIAAKHQAMLETIEMVRLVDKPVFVLKRELAAIPLFGLAMRRYGVIPVDRAAGAKALRSLLAAGRQALGDRRPVVIFPEGTRVAPGQQPPLQPGFAGLYRALDLPVVPVALDSGRYWTRGFVKRPGTVRILFGDPLPAGLPRQEIEALVHAGINALEDMSSPEWGGGRPQA